MKWSHLYARINPYPVLLRLRASKINVEQPPMGGALALTFGSPAPNVISSLPPLRPYLSIHAGAARLEDRHVRPKSLEAPSTDLKITGSGFGTDSFPPPQQGLILYALLILQTSTDKYGI